MKSLLFWIVLPFLLPQAIYVRMTAPRFSPAAGLTEGTVGEGKAERLLAIGDSIVAGVGAAHLSRALVGQTAAALANAAHLRIDWHASGVSGYTSAKVVQHLVPELRGAPYDSIIVSVGVNDITRLTTVRSWRRNLSALLQALHSHSPGAVIVVAGMPPLQGFPLLPQPMRALFGMRAQMLDEVARQLIGKLGYARHVPLDFDPDPAAFAPDGYHPSEESYTEFGQHMAEEILSARSTRP